jgi:alkylation response protein AidB-like acyl-CoA dehydrogenase
MTPSDGILAKAETIADEVFFPHAMDVERASRVPRSHLDLLALRGFYGLAGPADVGGLGLQDMATALTVVEILASGCLSTAFVWAQHHGVVLKVATSDRPELREEWLGRLCSGDVRAGVSQAGVLPGRHPTMHARAVPGGWIFDGDATWLTGWGLVDVVQVAARTDDGVLVWGLIDPYEAVAGHTMTVRPLEMVAVQASATVRAHVNAHFVPDARITGTMPFSEWPARDAASLAMNGFLALGVARRSCLLLGPSPLGEELRTVRTQLTTAPPEELPTARAAASALALRASAALLVHGGSVGILADQHPQRLAREALFVQVFGSRPVIKYALLRHYT